MRIYTSVSKKIYLTLAVIFILAGSIFTTLYIHNLTTPSTEYIGKKIWSITKSKKIIGRDWVVGLAGTRVIDTRIATLEIDTEGDIPPTITVSILSKMGKPISSYVYNHPTSSTNAIKITVSPELISQEKKNSYLYVRVKEEGPKFKIKKMQITLYKDKVIVKNDHSLEAYTPRISYYPGEIVEIKAHSPKPVFHVEVFRYGQNTQKLLEHRNIHGIKQNYTSTAYRDGANWKTSYSFKIPENWRSGLYACKLSDNAGHSFFSTFVVKDKETIHKKILVIASTNTWSAYNEWGGGSFYRYHQSEQLKPKLSQIINTQRPNSAANPTTVPVHLADAEKLVLGWLERHGYSYSLISDTDLHFHPELLKKYNTVLLNTHAEYWTKNMYNGFKAFLNQGGNAAVLSANAIYAKTVLQGPFLETRKIFGKHVLNGENGGLWRHFILPESSVLGVKYTNKGFGTFHPYKVLKPDHWIFKGTGLQKNDLIGKKGVNPKRAGASGHELDKMDLFSPTETILLAKGTNPGNTGAEMIYYTHHRGGGVFSTGSITFGNSLVVDSNLSQMLQNVLNHFLSENK